MSRPEPADSTFTHVVRDVDEQFANVDPFSFRPPSGARIRMDIAGDGFWLTANSEGYLHLARVFAEVGLRKLEDGWHFHVDPDFGSRTEEEVEFSFMLDNSASPPESAEDLR